MQCLQTGYFAQGLSATVQCLLRARMLIVQQWNYYYYHCCCYIYVKKAFVHQSDSKQHAETLTKCESGYITSQHTENTLERQHMTMLCESSAHAQTLYGVESWDINHKQTDGCSQLHGDFISSLRLNHMSRNVYTCWCTYCLYTDLFSWCHFTSVSLLTFQLVQGAIHGFGVAPLSYLVCGDLF